MLKDERLECKNKQGAIIDLQASLNISKAEIAGLQEKIKSDSLSTELTKRDEAIDELNNQVIELRLQKAVLEKKIDVSQRVCYIRIEKFLTFSLSLFLIYIISYILLLKVK